MSTHPTTRLTSSAAGLFSNTYVVDAPDGVIVVDPPMLTSDARAVRAYLDTRDRPLAGIVYTHPHPDHVNGGTLVRAGSGAPVYATPETDRVSREIDGPKRDFWTEQFPDDYPPLTKFATELVPGGTTVTIGGLPFEVVDIGPGECAAASVWICGDDAFVGDLVYANMHPWLFEGRSGAWLAQLEASSAVLDGRTLYAGHGAPGGTELLVAMADYLRAYRAAVRDLADGRSALDEDGTAELARVMSLVWPSAPLLDLVLMSADSIAAELAAEVSASEVGAPEVSASETSAAEVGPQP